jgi:Protein of unknown function (DUF3761)
MKNITVAGFIAAPLLAIAMAMPSFAADPAPTTCKDGTTTTSTGKGTCSGHGGVQKAAAAAPAAPAAAKASKAPAAPAAGATTTCSDGTTTSSSGKGTCSGHGGIQKATKAKPATAATTAPAAAPAAATPAAAPVPAASTTAAKTSTATKSAPTATSSNTDPTGATAKCKDGTYSKSAHRSGTCSSHGGVAEWLTAAQ